MPLNASAAAAATKTTTTATCQPRTATSRNSEIRRAHQGPRNEPVTSVFVDYTCKPPRQRNGTLIENCNNFRMDWNQVMIGKAVVNSENFVKKRPFLLYLDQTIQYLLIISKKVHWPPFKSSTTMKLKEANLPQQGCESVTPKMVSSLHKGSIWLQLSSNYPCYRRF